MIKFKNINKVFENKKARTEALKNINIEVSKGDIFGFIGFSGAGKSTLVRLVNLLEKPTSGSIIVDGENIMNLDKNALRKKRKDIGMVFQHFNLLNSKTVFDNIALPLILKKTPKDLIEKRVYELLKFVGLEEKAKSYPNNLSGGQKQRIGIARALATNPSILLCDEATSALDPKTTTSILELLKKINKEMGITILIITHEMNVIKDICNKVAVMENGRIIENGEVIDVFGMPKEETTKSFVSTVISDRVPRQIALSVKENKSYHATIKLKIRDYRNKRIIISNICKKFDVSTSILFAIVTDIQDTTLANITIDLQGKKEEVEKAFDYIRQQDIYSERIELKC